MSYPVVTQVLWREVRDGFILARRRRKVFVPFAHYPIWHTRIFTMPGQPGRKD